MVSSDGPPGERATGEGPEPAELSEPPEASGPPATGGAPPAQQRPPSSRARLGPGVAVALGLAGLLFVASGSTAAGTDLRSETDDLASLIAGERARADDEARVVDQLRLAVDELTSDAAAGDGVLAGVEAAAAELAGPAGLEPLAGPAVVVTLDDAEYGSPATSRADPDDLIVHQQDVQAVVNALWVGGAEGMMLMDQRVISTSAVRCVGNTLSLQGRPYSPPYVVTAVGDVDGMLAALDGSPQVQIYRQYVSSFGLGYSVEEVTEVELPAYTGPLELQHASAAAEVEES